MSLNDFNTVMERTFTMGGAYRASDVTLKSGSVETTYHFTPVPEVSSSLLTGLAGALAFRRRRRA
ncbi:MAG: hypothetical protein JWL81_839 [Verrucomicrobiales bacterium]|nr:hypothetical protein [Verrucomicrobiales bacterium]